MEQIKVNLSGGRAYPVWVGAGAWTQAAAYAPEQVAIVSNLTVFNLYGGKLLAELRATKKNLFTILIKEGEQYKSLASLTEILDQFIAQRLGRDGGVIALGGGVIGDLAGFAAAVYMRGVPVVQLPTTLLAQVDAAIGGKTGVNHRYGKNLIGAFHQPRAVLCEPAVLQTLPSRQYYAGLAEVVKYGLLADAEFFAWLEEHHAAVVVQESAAATHIIRRSAEIKAAIIAADEKETGQQRALLNLGHTFAHAIETVDHYRRLHGEAVACGLLAAARLSEEVCGFPPAATARIKHLLAALKLPTSLPPELEHDALIAAMELDKKNIGGGKRFILMRAIGDAFISAEVDDGMVRRALEACT